MRRHRFLIVIPVADRPRHIEACLGSLQRLLLHYPAAHPVRVLIADDSADATQVIANREIAARFSTPQLDVIHFDQDEQWTLAAPWRDALPGIVGNQPRTDFGHKGQGVMRNIAYLKVAAMLRDAPDDDLLIWSIDSDQEFRVDAEDDDGYVIDYFQAFDGIFSATDAEVLTGKVVGDPPVSPAVMTANFLADIAAFLHSMAATRPGSPCLRHDEVTRRNGDAAYHDMADLFGFTPDAHYAYPCPLTGPHTEADCFAHFAGRVNSFFYGEHPTRLSRYEAVDLFTSLQPARTVYAGNYIFRPSALRYFIPFADLRLRMSGPTLGRMLKAELGSRFVSANLPMLHRRTVDRGGQAEFRPGIAATDTLIDIRGEFERQFYGDVMLFTIEHLAAEAPLCRPADANFSAVLDAVHADLLEKYNRRQQVILQRLDEIETLLDSPNHWWHTSPATEHFRRFCANVRRNFGDADSGQARINAADAWPAWRPPLLLAIERYPMDRQRWAQAACVR